MASIALSAGSGDANSPDVRSPVSGIMIFEIVMAAGTLIMEAVSMWPIMSGIALLKMLAYNTITVPAMVAMPDVIRVNISLRVIFSK